MSEEREGTKSLAELNEEERVVSTRRRRLHDRIDFLRGGGMSGPDGEAMLAHLLEEEKDVSNRRRELHALIDARRAELGIAAGPEPKDSLRDR